MSRQSLVVAWVLGVPPSLEAIGAGWDEQPALALAISYGLSIPLLPLALYLLRDRTPGTAGDHPPGGSNG